MTSRKHSVRPEASIMGETSSKKRKRDGEPSSKPGKRVVLDVPPPTAAVSSVLQAKNCPPVIARAPGIEMPKKLLFHSYQPRDEPRPKKQSKHAAAKELLLHSTAHRSLDLTAREEEPRGSGLLVKHYVGIYDPRTGRLEVIEAKKMVVRGQVRAKQAPSSSADNTVKQSIADRRTDLGETFGTKKAKKAIREKVLNAISPQKKPRDNMPTKVDSASRAMLESVGAITSQMATQEELQATVDEAKPVPRANTAAKDIQDVYDPEAIIGADILNLVPIREWQEKARHGEGIQIQSQFVAARVNAIATNDEAVTRLRVLRYLGFVVVFYLSTKRGNKRGTRRLPSREELRENLTPAPEAVIENIRRKFSDGGVMRKFHVDLLKTHCCVFACIVDNFEVDTQNLSADLRLDAKEMNQYFHEIGARVKQVTNNKADGQTVNVARLALPLNLPKQRRIASWRK